VIYRHLLNMLMSLLLIGSLVAWVAIPDTRSAISLLLLLFAPGAFLAHLFRFAPEAAWPVHGAIWIGLSVALITLLYEWATVVHLALLPPIPTLIIVLCAIGISLLAWSKRHATMHSHILLNWNIGIMLLFLAALALRFYQIRDLVLPAWVDSLHHALLIRIAAETGQMPVTLQPYLPVEHLTYHWGYHVVSAMAFQAANSPLPASLPQGMLWYGQIIGTLMVPAYAGLASYLWRRPFAGLIAGLTVGFLSVMPAFFISWGRYTLLMGLLVLPAVLISTHMALHTPSLRTIVLASIALAGLSLVHFVVFVFALIWCLALIVVERPRRWYTLGAALLGAGTITLPWLIFLVGQARLGSGASATYVAGNVSYNALPFELLWAGNNKLLLIVAGISVLLEAMRRSTIAALVTIWCALIMLLANPWIIGLPYLSFVTNETVVICLFVPCSLLIGGGSAIVLEWASLRMQRHRLAHRAGVAVIIVLISALTAWGTWTSRSIIRPDTILADRDDLAAITWVSEHTPTTARFLVNTAGWLGSVDRGADGGWWLLPLANRQVSTPPVLYTYADDTTVAAIQRTTHWLRDTNRPTDVQLANFMREHGFTYVYAVVGGIQLDAARLRDSALFEPVYMNGRVTILRLR